MSDIAIIQADARQIPLRDECVQCVVTSPPYWGLREYRGEQEVQWADGTHCAFGLEPTLKLYVAHTVEILREVRRVLRPDGVVLWNIGDSYHNGDKGGYRKGRLGLRSELQRSNMAGDIPGAPNRNPQPRLKPKDLCLIPERVAIAAQADGWWVRSMIIWAKPNPMPESCTDRPTGAYEHILMLTKSERYFWDADAVREPSVTGHTRKPYAPGQVDARGNGHDRNGGSQRTTPDAGSFRNLRNVWTFATQPYRGSHFATFPEEIPRRCILAATSERGACVTCGAPWHRVTKRKPMEIRRTDWGEQAGNRTATSGTMLAPAESETLGWKPTCKCFPGLETRPCLVLDPFGGSGTTARVAVELNRRAVSLDLAYHDHAERRTRNVQRNLIGA